MKQVKEDEIIGEIKPDATTNNTYIRKIILNGIKHDYVFRIPEDLHLRIPEDLRTKDRSLFLYLVMSLLGYKPEIKERGL